MHASNFVFVNQSHPVEYHYHKKVIYIPNTYLLFLSVIGNGAPGCSKSLYLHTDHNRYLFNCGETSQKVITEYVGSNSLSQLTNIFVTSKTWNNIGGLPGMCLSIRGAGSPDVRYHSYIT